MERLSKRLRTGMVAAAALGMMVLSAQAYAQSFSPLNGGDNFYTSYYDVSTSATTSASGYGKPAGASGLFSGGSGDSLVRGVNPTHNDTKQLGTLCAMFYVFDDIEEMQACCGCPITPDGLRTLSVINNLTTNFGVNRANLAAGVIDVVASPLNFACPSNQPNCTPDSKAVNLETQGGQGCDPSGGHGSPELPGSTDNSVTPVTGLRLWMSHTEGNVATPPTASLTTGVSIEEFATAPLDSTHLNSLEGACGFLLTNGSGRGVCTCGSGDSSSLRRPKKG